MGVLSDPDRFDTWAALMREIGGVGVMTKADLRAAIDAADTWANSNAASYNSALPVTARSALTAPQKAMLLSFVIKKRYDKGA